MTIARCPCRYKHEIRKEDKEALRKLIKVQYHYQVSPEISRELDASRYTLLSAGSVQLALCFAAQIRLVLVRLGHVLAKHCNCTYLLPDGMIVSAYLVVDFCVCMLLYWSASKSTSLKLHMVSLFVTYWIHYITVVSMRLSNRRSESYC